MTGKAAPAPAGLTDGILPFTVEALDLRGRVVVLGPALDAMLKRHAYPEPVSRLLAEAVALTVMLGSSLKFEGRFILQTQSDGPVRMLVVDFQTPDRVRACARLDETALAAAIEAGRVAPVELLGNGHLAMTVDQGDDRNRYQGVVVLDGESLEAAAHRYFAQSEQIPTVVRLAVAEVVEAGGASWRAGGLMAQFLPASGERARLADLPGGDVPEGAETAEFDEDDAWVEARSLVATIADHELVDPALPPERLLYRLFHERGVRVFPAEPVVERCRCSHDHVEGLLRSFTPEDRADMTVDGEIVVTCEFCNLSYHFDPADFG
ncbi:MAG TPA: Hsp33 family molecular chaperone [Hyphomicrobiales bacterium]|nr:Hsp33 family molecular chaperone [Kaistiaceae bacterium]HQF31902.1 Hsp33 family molecular chaperone [Hyphomicrobiales bacterium]